MQTLQGLRQLGQAGFGMGGLPPGGMVGPPGAQQPTAPTAPMPATAAQPPAGATAQGVIQPPGGMPQPMHPRPPEKELAAASQFEILRANMNQIINATQAEMKQQQESGGFMGTGKDIIGGPASGGVIPYAVGHMAGAVKDIPFLGNFAEKIDPHLAERQAFWESMNLGTLMSGLKQMFGNRITNFDMAFGKENMPNPHEPMEIRLLKAKNIASRATMAQEMLAERLKTGNVAPFELPLNNEQDITFGGRTPYGIQPPGAPPNAGPRQDFQRAQEDEYIKSLGGRVIR